jgi:hypothetical protein
MLVVVRLASSLTAQVHNRTDLRRKSEEPVRQVDMMMPCPVASVIAASSRLGRALGDAVKARQ